MADIPVRMILEESSKAKLKNAISSLKKEVKKELFQHNGTNGKLSKQVRKILISNIISQKYISLSLNVTVAGKMIEKSHKAQQSLLRTEPHTSRYKRWKRQYGIGRGKKLWWILFGDLLKSIESWKVEDGFKSGINAYVVSRGGASWQGKGDKGAPKPIAMYARILEKRQPVFHPTLNEIIPTWQAEWNIALERIGKSWK